MNCASCHKVLGVLKYKGTAGLEYCSNACYEKLELTRSRHVSTTEDDMIEKKKKTTTPEADTTAAPKKNKQATPQEPAPKKKKTVAPVEDSDVDPPGDVDDTTDPVEAAPKKKKKAAPVEEAPEPKAPKKKKKAPAPEPEAPAKKKKAEPAAPKKVSAIPASQTKVAGGHANPYRPGTLFAEVFARLSHGKKHTIEKLFDGLTAGDPRRVLSNMKDRGETTEGFTLTRNQDKTYTLTITATK